MDKIIQFPEIERQNITTAHNINEGTSHPVNEGTLENINSIKVCTTEEIAGPIIDDNPMLTDKCHSSYAMLKTKIERNATFFR